MNVLNGGAHADTNVDVQEFMLAPVGAASFAEGAALGRRDVPRAQGAAARPRPRRPRSATKAASRPNLPSNEEALALLLARDRARRLHARRGDRARARRRVDRALRRRPLRARRRGRRLLGRRSGPTAWSSCATATRSCRSRTAWPRTTGTAGAALTERLGGRVQLVGDDLFVTNVERLAARASTAASPTRS